MTDIEATSPRFAAATAVTQVSENRYIARIAEGWDIAGNANGGYLLAMAARAVADATGRPDPVSITAHFLAPGAVGPVTISIEPQRTGGRHSTCLFTMAASGVKVLAGVATTTELVPLTGPTMVDVTPPQLPPPDECVVIVPGDPFPPPFVGQVIIRLHPDDAGFQGEPSGVARMRGWFRLHDGEPMHTLALLLAVDAFPPTSFNARLPIGWTPTVELTTHVRRRPIDGWIACSFATRHVANGYLEADGELWDATGALVAQSRQLMLIPAG